MDFGNVLIKSNGILINKVFSKVNDG